MKSMRIVFLELGEIITTLDLEIFKINSLALTRCVTTVSILLVRKANAKGSVSGFEIATPSKGGGSDKHLAVN